MLSIYYIIFLHIKDARCGYAISNIAEQTLGESYCFVISLSFMSPTAVVFIAVNRIVEQKFSECY